VPSVSLCAAVTGDFNNSGVTQAAPNDLARGSYRKKWLTKEKRMNLLLLVGVR
jgi:hypothetical protein